MSRRAARSKLCPTPSKTDYYTEEEATDAAERFAVQIAAAGRKLRPFYVYRCACLRYHLTHHSYSRDGRHNRKATP